MLRGTESCCVGLNHAVWQILSNLNYFFGHGAEATLGQAAMSGREKLSLKIIIIGELYVGKTSLMSQYCSGHIHNKKGRPRKSGDFFTKEVNVPERGCPWRFEIFRAVLRGTHDVQSPLCQLRAQHHILEQSIRCWAWSERVVTLQVACIRCSRTAI